MTLTRSSAKRTPTSPPATTRVRAISVKPRLRSEAEVLADVRRYLAAHPAVAKVIRINSGATWLPGGAGGKQFVRFCEIDGQSAVRSAARAAERRNSAALAAAAESCEEAVPDLIGFMRDGRFLAIEVKRQGWTKPTDRRERAQARFIASVLASGGIAGFVSSLAEMEAILGYG